MKTAISLPDALFRRADRLARTQNISRSALVQRALEAYLQSRGADVTGDLNAALDDIGRDEEDANWVRATSALLARRRP
jgi:metal-responsive CopG/Arc/MetJ family transcriptional regulator